MTSISSCRRSTSVRMVLEMTNNRLRPNSTASTRTSDRNTSRIDSRRRIQSRSMTTRSTSGNWRSTSLSAPRSRPAPGMTCSSHGNGTSPTSSASSPVAPASSRRPCSGEIGSAATISGRPDSDEARRRAWSASISGPRNTLIESSRSSSACTRSRLTSVVCKPSGRLSAMASTVIVIMLDAGSRTRLPTEDSRL